MAWPNLSPVLLTALFAASCVPSPNLSPSDGSLARVDARPGAADAHTDAASPPLDAAGGPDADETVDAAADATVDGSADASTGADADVPSDAGNDASTPDASRDAATADASRDAAIADASRDAATSDAGRDGGVDGSADAAASDSGGFGLPARPSNPTCLAPARPQTQSGVTVERAFTSLTFNQPIGLVQAPGDASRIYVLERLGRVRSFPSSATAQPADVRTVVDITSKIDTNGEGGFLGFAFHPRWATQKELFLSYTETGVNGHPLRSVISRVRSTDNGVTFNPQSEEVLLKLDQPYANHNGGNIAFGPDGYLYIGFGDGGSSGDPENTGQRLNTLLGKMLRINVEVPAATKYTIPASNPYAAGGTPCQLSSNAADAPAGTECAEIYALGFRNPWRWSFDTATQELWVGDVGQGTWEEIDRVELGGNYGWKIREGAHCYRFATCETAGLIDPVVEYDHTQGVSITGGYVYRGSRVPALVGHLVFADYGSGRVWSLDYDQVSGQPFARLLQATGINIASFGQTLDGEVYALGIQTGQIYELRPSGAPPIDPIPARLSESGCFSSTDPQQPLPALIPYDVNAPLYSDGAAKERFFAIPDGTTITIGTDGDWTFPNGTVLAKTFYFGARRVETRLFMRHPDGVWAGYTYEWADDESDAVLLPAGKTKVVGTQTWTYPSRAECLACHTETAGRSLGLETAQLNREFRYPTGLTRHQLLTLEGLGFFSAPLGQPVSQLPRLSPPSGNEPVPDRARAYLHSNCSFCHRAGGAGQGPQDFRASLSFQAMGICDVAPQHGDLGVTNARLFAPGAPDRSVISLRTKALDANRMPPLASLIVDQAGVALLDQWIRGVTVCPP